MQTHCIGIWISILMTLLLNTAAEDSAHSLVVDHISVVNASPTSITVEAHMQCGEHCIRHNIIWQYSEGFGDFVHTSDFERFEMWSGAGGIHRKKIDDLKPGTLYRIGGLVQSWRKTEAPEKSPHVLARTCPAIPQRATNLEVDKMPGNWHRISWTEPDEKCASTSYYVHLIGEGNTVHALSHKCKNEGIFLGNVSRFLCQDHYNDICFLLPPDDIENKSIRIIEVLTTDSSEVCSRGIYTSEVHNHVELYKHVTVAHSLSKPLFNWIGSLLLIVYMLLFISLF